MYEIRTYQPNNNRFFIRTSKGGINPCIEGYIKQNGADVLANCVGYACGRYAEAYYQATGIQKMWALSCNAKNMLERAKSLGLSVSSDVSTIKAGSCVVFGGATYGHIIFVEKVIDSDTFLVSESNYGGTSFVLKERKHSKNWGYGAGLKYLGHILPQAKMEEKKEEPRFKVGTTYRTLYNINVRVGAGTNYRKKAKKELTINGQKNANDSGSIKPNTLVTCLEVAEVDGNTWIRIPSGWIVGFLEGKECIR